MKYYSSLDGRFWQCKSIIGSLMTHCRHLGLTAGSCVVRECIRGGLWSFRSVKFFLSYRYRQWIWALRILYLSCNRVSCRATSWRGTGGLSYAVRLGAHFPLQALEWMPFTLWCSRSHFLYTRQCYCFSMASVVWSYSCLDCPKWQGTSMVDLLHTSAEEAQLGINPCSYWWRRRWVWAWVF